MNCLDLPTTDPAFNLAVEEVLLKRGEEEFFILYTNSPSVIIGRNQIANREADTVFCHKNSIPIIRRITGGGTVYHDHGNLNFSFISNGAAQRQDNFKRQTEIILQFLSKLGVEASLGGKNDIKANGMKISGNAETVFRDRVLRHGTLLVEADMERLNGAIRKDLSNYYSRSVASNPSPTRNIKEMVNGQVTTEGVKKGLYTLFLSFHGNSVYSLPTELKEAAESLSKTKYSTWEWNFGSGPNYSFQNNFRVGEFLPKCRLEIVSGVITDCTAEGSEELDKILRPLKGTRHHYPEILLALNETPLKQLLINLLF